MTSQFKRTDRIAELIQRKLSYIIKKEIKDPRLPQLITISAVKVSSDLSHAKVYFTALNSDIKLVVQILNASAGYLRTALGRSLTTRSIPQLHFVYDESLEYARHLTKLIDDANAVKPDESED